MNGLPNVSKITDGVGPRLDRGLLQIFGIASPEQVHVAADDPC